MKKTAWSRLVSLLVCLSLMLVFALWPSQSFASMDGDDDENSQEAEVEAEDEAEVESEPPAVSAANSAVAGYQKEISSINSELDNLEKEKQKIQDSIKRASSAKEEAQLEKLFLDQQIYNTKSAIDLLEENISYYELDIEEKLGEIDIKQADIDEKYDLFKKRLRAMDMSSDANTLGLVLGADSFVDFLTKTDTIVRVADHDQQLMKLLAKEKRDLEQSKLALESSKKELEADRETAQEKRHELGVQQQAASLKVHDLVQMEQEFLADLAKNKAKQAAMQQEIQNLYKKIEWSKNPYVGGEMLWPVPNYSNISSNYGSRFGGSDFHTGTDISGSAIHGKPVVAANDGTVKVANWSYTPGYSYGIYIVIDHGGKISTLYGHLSNILVSVGQEVSRGDVIGEVGNTGWSTGPHLHFEVRVDGGHTNPLPYVTG